MTKLSLSRRTFLGGAAASPFVLSGLIGGFVGTWLFHVLNIPLPGLVLFGVNLIPAFVGAVIIAVAAQLITSRRPLS